MPNLPSVQLIRKFDEDIHKIPPYDYLDFTYSLSERNYRILANFMIKQVILPDDFYSFNYVMNKFYRFIERRGIKLDA